MSRSFVLPLLALVVAPTVTLAGLKGHPEANIELLKSIPLFPGVEKRVKDEDGKAKTLVGIFTKIQNEGRTKQLERGTHSKGSCFNGEIEIFSADELKSRFKMDDPTIARVRQGLFARAAKMPTTIRFANAKGTTNADTVGDVRGVSLSIDTSGHAVAMNGDARQDYMFNSSPMFAVRNITEFTELLKAARLAQGDFDYFVNPLYIKAILRGKNLLEEYERNDTVSYAVESYWSNVPYSHGLKSDGSPREIVKYKFSPCDPSTFRRESSAGKASDYLQVDIDRRAAEGRVCFLLQVQLFDQKKMETNRHAGRSLVDWVENGGELWEESLLPFKPIARVIIAGDGKDATTSSKKISCDDVGISTLLHSQRANQPLGSLARVRSLVEENSRARRMGEKR